MKMVFDQKVEYSNGILKQVRDELEKMHSNPSTACVYATGSMARGEASEGSDLDLFMIDTALEKQGHSGLSNTDAILLKADLIRVGSTLNLPAYSGDGVYLQVHKISDITGNIGSREDDSGNSFTARLLLILESKHLLNEEAHLLASDVVINSYWRDFDPDNSKDFLPVFLANDIMRFWKTLCLNYESERNLGAPTGINSDEWKNSNRLKDIKLKFSRKWICQMTLVYLLWATSGNNSMNKKCATGMISLTPRERLQAVMTTSEREGLGNQVLELYGWFLETIPSTKKQAIDWVADDNNWAEARAKGKEFGKMTFDLLDSFKDNSRLYQYLIG